MFEQIIILLHRNTVDTFTPSPSLKAAPPPPEHTDWAVLCVGTY